MEILPEVIVLDEESCVFVPRGIDRAGRRVLQDNVVIERVVLPKGGIDLTRSNRQPSQINVNNEGKDHWKELMNTAIDLEEDCKPSNNRKFKS